MVIPEARLKFYRRVSSLAALAKSVTDAPELMVRAILHLWQQCSYPLIAQSRAPRGTSAILNNPAIQDFANWLNQRPFNEAAYWLATAYASWLGETIKTERALFFTPPRLAERVIANLEQHGASITEHHWHDPACGGSAFLVPIAQKMEEKLRSAGIKAIERLKHIESNLTGNDLDPVLLNLSAKFLEMALYPSILDSGYRPNFTLLKGDGLTSQAIESLRPDVLACNPPYRKLKAVEVERYRSKHDDIVERQPNIYGLFINRTLQLAHDGTLIGLLTPTSFLSGKSFSKLRSKLVTKADVLQIDMLSDRTAMFINVEQETVVTVLRTREIFPASPYRTTISVLGTNGEFDSVGRYSLPSCGKPWPIPRAIEDAELLQNALSSGFQLDDYGYIAKVGHLVAYRDKRPRFKTLPKSSKNNSIVPLVWATDVSPSGAFEHGRDTKLQRSCRYVKANGPEDSSLITKPVVLLQRLTSSDQRSRLVAAAVPQSWIHEHGGFICENHVIVLEPMHIDAVRPKLMARILNSRIVDRVFRSISGASNVAISELNQLLLPNPFIVQETLKKTLDIEYAIQCAYVTAEGCRKPKSRSNSTKLTSVT